MRNFLIGMALCCFAAIGVLSVCLYEANQTNRQWAVYAEDLKWYNCRTSRSKGNLNAPQNFKAAQKAFYFTGCPVDFILAVHDHENGVRFHETGYNGQTEFVAAHYDLDERQYGETARLCSQLLWQWADSGKLQKAYPDPIAYIARTYTGGGAWKWKAWARSVETLRDREKVLLEKK